MFARIKRGIQSIQSSALQTRRVWLWMVSLVLFILVVLAWLLFFHYSVDTTGSSTASSTNPFSDLLRHVNDQFHSMTTVVDQGISTIEGVASSSVILYATSTPSEGSTTPIVNPSLEPGTATSTN